MQVLQETCIDLPTHTQLASPNGHVIAIIDRTAHLARAAQDLVAARFSFGATSPYAPDIVLVNEFVKKEFTELVLQQSIRFLTTSSASIHEKKNTKRLEEATDKNWKMKVITQGASGSVVELIGQSDIRNPLPAKQTSPVFAITAFTSLDHAIDLVSASAARPVLAAYHFAAPAHASYLSQFIAAETTFVNHVPNQISLGPAAPAFQPFELKKRYTIEHFSRVLPAFVSTSNDRLGFEGEKGVTKLLKNASQEIQEKKRPEWIAHGFFEQGIFIGLGVYGIPLLTCLGTGLFYGVRTGVRYVSLLK
jgi:aldehyde dehydrogenase (NAD+)